MSKKKNPQRILFLFTAYFLILLVQVRIYRGMLVSRKLFSCDLKQILGSVILGIFQNPAFSDLALRGKFKFLVYSQIWIPPFAGDKKSSACFSVFLFSCGFLLARDETIRSVLFRYSAGVSRRMRKSRYGTELLQISMRRRYCMSADPENPRIGA